MPNWKGPGKDGLQGYWIKNLSNLHGRIAVQMNKILMGDDSLPAWRTLKCTVLYQKDPRKGNAVENYCPITRLLIGVIAEQINNYLKQEKLLQRQGSRGTKDQLLIDKTMLKDCKKRHTNLSFTWIDCKKIYDFIPYSWISEYMELFGIADNVINFWEKNMEQQKLTMKIFGRLM